MSLTLSEKSNLLAANYFSIDLSDGDYELGDFWDLLHDTECKWIEQ